MWVDVLDYEYGSNFFDNLIYGSDVFEVEVDYIVNGIDWDLVFGWVYVYVCLYWFVFIVFKIWLVVKRDF